MLYRNHAGDKPVIAASATVHPSAVLIGNIQLGEKVFVGPNAVIRAAEPRPDGKVEAIVIESEVNVQDGAIIHALVAEVSVAVAVLALSDSRLRDELKAYRKRMREDVAAADAEVRNAVVA